MKSVGTALLAVLVPALLNAAQVDRTPTVPVSEQADSRGDPARVAERIGGLSEARLLIRIQQIIAQDQQRLRSLESGSDHLAREFEAASRLFDRLDAELEEARQADKSPAELQALEQLWALARDALDPLLQRRQAMDRQIKILKVKLDRQREALDYVSSGRFLPSLLTPATPSPAPGPAGEAAAEPSPQASFSVPPGLDVIAPERSRTTQNEPATPAIYDRRVADASRELRKREGELRLAEHGARLVDQLTSLNQDDLTQAKALAETSHSQKELLEVHAARLQRGLEALPEAAPGESRKQLADKIAELHRRAAATAATAADDAGAVAALEQRVKSLSTFRVTQERHVSEAESAVESARRRLVFLQSPLAPHRMARWFLDTAPRVALILAVLALLWLGARWLTHRLVQRMVSLGRHGAAEGRIQRVETLQRVLRSGITIAFVIVGMLAVLPEFGVDVTVLMGGAAVFSLALAFGAQSLVKDYFAGVMILIEDQYRVGNVVGINDKQGTVEDISLRMTTLRDLEGVAHLVPHGQITTVSNMTHGWSQVMLNVGVAYKENVDRAMEVLVDVAREMRKEPQFDPLILDEPEMLGVDAFAESAVVIKFLVRTRPLKQWIVKRELLRRIKNRFDELGIELPVPHRTVYHHGLEQPFSVQLTDGSAGASKQRGEGGSG